MPGSEPTRSQAGFTLVELVIVMALLAVIAALSAPAMSRSIRARHLKDEAARFLAATEYGREEAISQGVPMRVWIDPTTQRFGVSAKAGFDGVEARDREFTVGADIHFEMTGAAAGGEVVEAVEFAPDGAPGEGSIAAVKLVDRFENTATIARTKDGWGYEILKEEK